MKIRALVQFFWELLKFIKSQVHNHIIQLLLVIGFKSWHVCMIFRVFKRSFVSRQRIVEQGLLQRVRVEKVKPPEIENFVNILEVSETRVLIYT